MLRALLLPWCITLAVTLLRLYGELHAWPDWLCGRAAGGSASVLGIGWLVPVFGIVFARRLAATGAQPTTRAWRQLGLGMLTMIGGMLLARSVLGVTPASMAFACGTCMAGAWLASRGWPELARWNLAYAIGARAPIFVITALAIGGNWGTHYEQLAPGAPVLDALPRFLVLVLAQTALWLPITVLGGGFAGLLAVSSRRSGRSRRSGLVHTV